MDLNNVRTDNILTAAAEVTKARTTAQYLEDSFKTAEARYLSNKAALDEAKERLLYALKKLDDATCDRILARAL